MTMRVTALKPTRPRYQRDVVMVVGLDDVGLSAVAHLRRHGDVVHVMDSRDNPPALAALRAAFPDVPVTLGGISAAALARAARIVLSPGVPLMQPAIAAAVNAGVEVLGDVELFARAAPAPVVAIAGSSGRSTVASLLGAMACEVGIAARIGGDLAAAPLDLLVGQDADLYFLALSSVQLESTWSLTPQVAALLNVSTGQLGSDVNFAADLAAGARIFSGAAAAVINLDDVNVARLCPDVPHSSGFSLAGDPAARALLTRHRARMWLMLGETPVLRAEEVPLPGRHNLSHVLAALAVGDALGWPAPAMGRAVAGFAGLAKAAARRAPRAALLPARLAAS